MRVNGCGLTCVPQIRLSTSGVTTVENGQRSRSIFDYSVIWFARDVEALLPWCSVAPPWFKPLVLDQLQNAWYWRGQINLYWHRGHFGQIERAKLIACTCIDVVRDTAFKFQVSELESLADQAAALSLHPSVVLVSFVGSNFNTFRSRCS